ISTPKKDDFKIRLAKDLHYSGLATDDETLEKFIYEDLGRRLGGTTAHVRKSPFDSPEPRRAYAVTKKATRKVVPKASSKQVIRHCSVCGKAGHTKVNCPRIKRTKKINYVYNDEVEEPEDPEEYIEEYIVEEEDEDEEEEIEDDDVEYV